MIPILVPNSCQSVTRVTMMKTPQSLLSLNIQKGVSVSLHQQLVTQLSLQIASGHLTAGTRLPSVRALARQLEIHYNTISAVYKELGELGMVESHRGSGVIVTRFKTGHVPGQLHSSWQGSELMALARQFLMQIRRKGFTWEEAQQALSQASAELEVVKPLQLVFVDIHTDILPLFVAELSHSLGQPVQGRLLEELGALVKKTDAFSPDFYLVSRYHHRSLLQVVGESAPAIIIDVGSGQHEMDLIRSLPPGSLITIVSHSSIILSMGESLINGLQGQDILVRTVLYSEGWEEIQQAVKYAKLVIGDFLTTPELTRMTRKPVRMIRLVPETEMEKIKGLLES